MQITIEKVEVRKDKNEKDYHAITDANGKVFYYFGNDINIIGKFVNGRGAVLEIEATNEQYPKITAAKLLHYKPLTNKLSSDEIKNRSVAISYAKDLVCAGKSDLADIEKLADRILAYVGGTNG